MTDITNMNVQGISAYAPFGSTLTATAPRGLSQASLATGNPSEDHKVDATFAQEMSRRIAANYVRPEGEDKANYDPQQLADSLTRTTEYVRDRFGRQAATAFMGIVAASTGSGQVTEDSLGNGMLNAIRMVDANYGTKAGDELMANLNGDLNKAVNAYFDNGQDETIFAVTSASGSVYTRLGEAAKIAMDSLGKEAANSITELIKTSLQGGQGKYDLLRGNLAEVMEKLREKHGAQADSTLASLSGVLAGYPSAQTLPSGTLLSATV